MVCYLLASEHRSLLAMQIRTLHILEFFGANVTCEEFGRRDRQTTQQVGQVVLVAEAELPWCLVENDGNIQVHDASFYKADTLPVAAAEWKLRSVVAQNKNDPLKRDRQQYFVSPTGGRGGQKL